MNKASEPLYVVSIVSIIALGAIGLAYSGYIYNINNALKNLQIIYGIIFLVTGLLALFCSNEDFRFRALSFFWFVISLMFGISLVNLGSGNQTVYVVLCFFVPCAVFFCGLIFPCTVTKIAALFAIIIYGIGSLTLLVPVVIFSPFIVALIIYIIVSTSCIITIDFDSYDVS